MVFVVVVILVYLWSFAILTILLSRASKKQNIYVRSLWQSILLTLYFGFIIPCCWSKYGDMIPAPIILAVFVNPCIDEYYLKLPLFILFWLAFFYFFVFIFKKVNSKSF